MTKGSLSLAAGSLVVGVSGRPVLRLLLAGSCRFSCSDCPFGVSRAFRDGRGSLPRQARSAVEAWRKGLCDGVYVTPGIPRRPVESSRRLAAFLALLREESGFRGYVHVKLVPGARREDVEPLLLLADRVSWTPEPRCARALEEALPKVVEGDLRRSWDTTGMLLKQARRDFTARLAPRFPASPDCQLVLFRGSPASGPANVAVRTGLAPRNGRGRPPEVS